MQHGPDVLLWAGGLLEFRKDKVSGQQEHGKG